MGTSETVNVLGPTLDILQFNLLQVTLKRRAELWTDISACFLRYVGLSCMNLTIDDYPKDGGSEEVSLLCSFYHEPLRT